MSTRVKMSDGINTIIISQKLARMGVKHTFLEGNELVILGRCSSLTVKGMVLVKEPIVFSKNKPKDNLLFLASLVKQSPEAIDRLVDLSRMVDEKETMEVIKGLIKSFSKVNHEFKLLLNHLSHTT